MQFLDISLQRIMIRKKGAGSITPIENEIIRNQCRQMLGFSDSCTGGNLSLLGDRNHRNHDDQQSYEDEASKKPLLDSYRKTISFVILSNHNNLLYSSKKSGTFTRQT